MLKTLMITIVRVPSTDTFDEFMMRYWNIFKVFSIELSVPGFSTVMLTILTFWSILIKSRRLCYLQKNVFQNSYTICHTPLLNALQMSTFTQVGSKPIHIFYHFQEHLHTRLYDCGNRSKTKFTVRSPPTFFLPKC